MILIMDFTADEAKTLQQEAYQHGLKPDEYAKQLLSSILTAKPSEQQNEHTVAETVRQYLKDCHPDGITFTVIEEEVRQDEFGWKVPVLLDKGPRKLSPYFEALTDVEIALADEAHLKVLLIPAFDAIDAAQEAA